MSKTDTNQKHGDYQHIYWFAPYDLRCASTRYRGKIPLDFLKENHGVSYDFYIPSRTLAGTWRLMLLFIEILFFRKQDALVVIQKVRSNRFYANILKCLIWMRPQHTLYDLDDAEQYRYPTKTFHFFIQHCTSVRVGSKALFDYCSQLNPNVMLATSPVYEHGLRKQQQNPKLHIGWVGDFGNGNTQSKPFAHKTSLYTLLFPALKALDFEVKFSIIGVKKPSDIPQIQAYFSDCPNIELHIPQQLDWTTDNWVYKEICTFDIGVSPLVNHPFNEAKSAFKAKQYLSCGVPVIGSKIGENTFFIKDNKNGFLVQNTADFVEKIKKVVCMNATTYMKFSTAAFQSKKAFSIQNYCATLVKKHPES